MAKNLLEQTVASLYDDVCGGDQHFCGCASCREDVITWVLNHARPRYVAGSTTGAAVTSVDLQREQTRAELTVLLFEGMRRVRANPHHELHRRASGPTGQRSEGGAAT